MTNTNADRYAEANSRVAQIIHDGTESFVGIGSLVSWEFSQTDRHGYPIVPTEGYNRYLRAEFRQGTVSAILRNGEELIVAYLRNNADGIGEVVVSNIGLVAGGVCEACDQFSPTTRRVVDHYRTVIFGAPSIAVHADYCDNCVPD